MTTSQPSGTGYLESARERLDQGTRGRRGGSLFHWLALGSIGASVALFLAGKKNAAIFVGLWPPTFEAMRR